MAAPRARIRGRSRWNARRLGPPRLLRRLRRPPSIRSTASRTGAPARSRACGWHPRRRQARRRLRRAYTVVDQDSGWEYDFWQVRRKPRRRRRRDLVGRAHPYRGRRPGLRRHAAHYGSLAGIIRAEEMRRGRIDHALFMSSAVPAALRSIQPPRTSRAWSARRSSRAPSAPPRSAPTSSSTCQTRRSRRWRCRPGRSRSCWRWPTTGSSSATPSAASSSSSRARPTPASASRIRGSSSPRTRASSHGRTRWAGTATSSI